MATDPKVERLAAVPLFKGCDKKELERLATAIDTLDVAAGHTLFRQGAIHHEAFIVEAGTAEVSVDGEVVAEIPEGEMIGEIGLLTRAPASATVVAKTAMSLLLIPHQRFEQIASDAPGLGLGMARELAHRLQAMDARMH